MSQPSRTFRRVPKARWIGILGQDLRYAVRILRKNPGFTLVAVASLALGVGANTAIFSVVNALLFRPLPFREPRSLVWIVNPVLEGEGIPGMSRRINLRDWRQMNHSFEALGGYIAFSERINYTLIGKDEPARLAGISVTRNFLDVLGVKPALGRNFTEEEQRNGPAAVILTDIFWRRQFGADPAIVGRSITINDSPWTVVGVLPPSFDFSEIFTPGARVVDFLRLFPNIREDDRLGNCMAVVGRLKSGATEAKAQTEFDLLNRQLQGAHPERGAIEARLIPLREHISGQFRRPLLVLSCAVGCVLLIACANLSNLLLARAATRRKEIALRVALGASRARLIRQMLTESLLLAGCGAALGLPLAYLATHGLAQSQGFNLPLLHTARVDGQAFSFALLTALFTGLLFGIVPAFQLPRGDVHANLREGGRGSSDGRRRIRAREFLVASEMALACLLLVGSGLLMRSFVRLLEIDLGFRPERVYSWRLEPDQFVANGVETHFYQEVLRRIKTLPGIESAALAASLPLGMNNVLPVRAKGETYRAKETPGAFGREVSQDYFETLRIPLRAGRRFDSHDAPYDLMHPAPTGEIVVINEMLAQLLWPGKDPIGRSLFIDDRDPPLECRVLGVVGNVRQKALEEKAGPEIYLLGGGRELIVRIQGPVQAVAPSIRSTLRAMNANLPVTEFKSLGRIVDQLISPKRLITLLLGLFSLLALLLAAIGIYGVIAYSVSRRARELGIRLALGSSRCSLLRLVISEGMRPAFIGCAIGLTAALALTRMIQALLFGVSPTDPVAYAASACVVARSGAGGLLAAGAAGRAG